MRQARTAHLLAISAILALLPPSLAVARTPTTATGHAGPAAVVRADPADGPAAQAKHTGKSVELTGSTTETRQVFVNPDGNHTLIENARPVRVRTAKGWTPVDHTLRFGAGGSVRPAAAGTGLVLSGGGPGSGLVSIGKSGARLRMSWPAPLPKPVLHGDTATYQDVFPGVDLQLRSEPAGFAQVLVVKNRTAALNPALRKLRFPVQGDGLTVSTKPDGTTVATDGKGRVVFASGQATMWEAGAETTRRHARLPVELGSGVLTVVPDQRLLTGADTKFPLSIDPSWAGFVGDMWTHVDEDHLDQSYWNFDRAEGAKVGEAYGADTDTYRSLFQLSTAGIAGARVIDAKFSITLDHSPSGTDTPVELWQTLPISRAEAVTWRNTSNHWLKKLAVASGSAWTGHEPDLAMGFLSTDLHNLVQEIADRGEQTITLGLKAPNETDPMQWKKFFGGTAAIVVTYNNAPRVPIRVNFTSPKPCGTAVAPAVINTVNPQFSAVASDPDGDNLTNRLEIFRASDGGSEYLQDSPLTGNGAAFSWSAVPAGELVDGGTYYFTARSDDKVPNDNLEYGPASAPCYFRIDARPPSTPAISSTDFPNGAPGRPAREVGIIQLTAAAVDTDVAEFAYGFTREKMTLRIKARPDGTASLPVTVPSGTRRLWVSAVDRAGNRSVPTQPWLLLAQSNPSTFKVRGDVNGDGTADVNLVLDHGSGRTGVWNLTSRNGTFTTGTMAWDSENSGGFALSRTRPVQGDFTNDGRADLAFFRDEPGRRVGLYLLRSDGDRYDAPSTPIWTSETAGWTIVSARVVAGDVDGDEISDIVVQLNTGNQNWRVLVFPGSNLGAPAQWLQTAAGSGDWALSDVVVADIDADKADDLVVLKKTATCRTVIESYRSTRTGFAAPTTGYDGDYCFDKGHPVVGDIDADGKDDVVSIYDNGAGTALRVFRSTGSAFQLQDWWTGTGWDPVTTLLKVGDYDKDGKEDAALVTSLTGGGREVFQLRSTGTAFSAPVPSWKETNVGASTGPRFDLEARTYELVARHSAKCMEVAGGSQTDPAPFQQGDCTNKLYQRFRIVPVAGTEQYEVQPAHVNGAAIDVKPRCLDVGNQSTADDTPIVQWKCVGTGNQQVLLDYVEGSSYDAVFRLRFGHSGKCAAIAAAGTANGAKLIQRPCATGAEQQWVLRAALNAPQLDGRYKIRTMRTIDSPSMDYVLDIADCDAAKGIRMWVWVPGSPCQRWQLKPLGDDVYQIIDPSTNKAVQVEGCSRLAGGKLVPFDIDAADCQRWRIEPAADGSYTLQQADTGHMMDVPECVRSTTDRVIVWHYWNGPCQRWQLTKT
ncbi:RICIN domain-containing protein [Kribbella sp. NPDC056951]|uniref:RICIN domain-containing protein n=1 Tax=Kribbella sp. NPDC056951 TaxID=3345978 RepID=UPI00362BDB4B